MPMEIIPLAYRPLHYAGIDYAPAGNKTPANHTLRHSRMEVSSANEAWDRKDIGA